MRKLFSLILLGLLCSVGVWADLTPALPSLVLDLTNVSGSDGAYNDGSSLVYAFSPYLIYNSTNPSWATANSTGSTGTSNSAISPFPASSEYGEGFKGATIKKGNAKGPYAYRVTNCISAFALVKSGSEGKRTCMIEAFEISAGVVAGEASKSNSTTSNSNTVISVTDLDASKEYYIKVSQSASTSDGNSTFFQIAFQAPKTDPTFSLSSTTISTAETAQIKVGSKSNLDGITLKNITYGTSGVVSVNSSGVITPIANGTTTISFQADATGKYNAVTSMTPLSITIKDRTATTMAFSTPTTSMGVDESITTNVATLTGGPGDAVITYSSDDDDIVEVNTATGEIIGVAVGSTTIRANYAGNEDYQPSSASYNITVVQSAVNNKFWNGGDWLAEHSGTYNDAIFIDNMEIKGTESTGVQITSGGEKTIDGHKVAARIRLGKAGSSDGNYLHFKVKPNTRITFWGIRASSGAESNGLALSFGSFGTNEQVYTFEGGNEESLQYTYTGVSKTDVYAYSKNVSGASMLAIKVEAIEEITLTATYNTYVTTNALDFTNVDGLKAYVATDADASTVTIEQVYTVPASTPLVLKGTASTSYVVPVVSSASAPETNYLVAGTGAAINSATKYVLSIQSGNYVFAPTDGDPATVPVGKAYLDLTSMGGAPSLLRIVEEGNNATNINTIEATEEEGVKFIQNGQLFIKRNGAVYDVMGHAIR